LIADIEELASAGFGVDMIYWMLELVEEFMRASAPDADARKTLPPWGALQGGAALLALYAQGRGFSSILRAIEDHLLAQPRC
jgi:hypothetical protein